MVPDEEPGRPLVLEGRVVEADTGAPLAGVVVELVHTDDGGAYSEDPLVWNPRLFAYLRTDDDGRFTARTIRPRSYPDDQGSLVPAHVHFEVSPEGYRPYGSEIQLADDPLFDAALAEQERLPVARPVDATDGAQTASVTLVVILEATP